MEVLKKLKKEADNILPLDIQIEILKKLPTKSLIRFRCVSKQWKSLIDSLSFILSYGFHPTNRFIVSYDYPPKDDDDDDNDTKVFSLIDNDNENCDTFANQYFAPVDPPGLLKYCDRYYGSSQGLICFNCYLKTGDEYGRIKIAVLWNPSIRRSVGIQLPRFQDWIDRFGDSEDFSAYDSIVGFGVCPVTIDPTIVNIKYGEHESDGSLRCIALVFTLSSRAWNILSTNLPLESFTIFEPQVVIDRSIYWVIIDEDDGFYKLLSFDLTAKEFRVIDLPDRLTLNCPRISNLRGSLVVLEQTTTPVASCYLWMMTMEGVTPSFTRQYCINLPATDLPGFRKSGEPIVEMRVRDKNYLYTFHVYDPHSQHFHRLRIDRDIYYFFMCSYMETLLLFDQSDGYIYHISN